jgi:peptidyl-prolyl cis-trans isomerase C
MVETRKIFRISFVVSLVFASFVVLSACQKNPGPGEQTPAGSGTTSPSEAPLPSATATITSTPEPMALTVNGEGVPLAEYQASLQQLQSAETQLGTSHTADEQRQMVLDDLTNEALLAQGAEKDGMQLDDATIQSRYDEFTATISASGTLSDWMNQMGYTESSLKTALQRSILAAWERDKLIAAVGDTADQVEARQILFQTQETAQSVLNQLNNGVDFATLAYNYDPLTGGDLGWFPRGYLTIPAVEDAAFSLDKGQYSQILDTDIGYIIVMVEDRDSQHPLSTDAKLTLQQKALDDWLAAQRQSSQVQVLLP